MDSRPSIIDPKLIENVFCVGAQGVQGHDQFAGNFRAAQFGSEKPKHFQFTLTQWLNYFGFQILDFGFWIGFAWLWKSRQESLHTLRTHTNNIFKKLGVNNRRAAVRRAEELDLL